MPVRNLDSYDQLHNVLDAWRSFQDGCGTHVDEGGVMAVWTQEEIDQQPWDEEV